MNSKNGKRTGKQGDEGNVRKKDLDNEETPPREAKRGRYETSPTLTLSLTETEEAAGVEQSKPANVSVLTYLWDDEVKTSVESPGEGRFGTNRERRRESISAETRMKGRAANLIRGVDKEIREMNKLISENQNTKKEIKQLATRLTSLVSQLSTKEVLDSLEEIYDAREIIVINDTKEQASQTVMTEPEGKDTIRYKEMGTQTDQTPWQKRNEDTVKKLRAQIATRRGYEGWAELEPREWPSEIFSVVREVMGNPIWENEEQNLAALLKEDDKMDKGISRQIRRRFPEIEQLQGTKTSDGCSCLIYEARLFAAGDRASPGRRTFARVVVGEDSMKNYMNILSWKEKVMALGLDRVAIFATEERWTQIKKMIEHVFWGTEIRIIAYSQKKGPAKKDQRRQKGDDNGKAPFVGKKSKRMPQDVVVVNSTDKTYTELLRSVKEKVKADTLGIKIRGARSTRTGDLLLTLDKEEGNAVRLKEAIDKELAQEGIVTRMGRQTDVIIHIKDLDATTSQQELKTAIAAEIEVEERLIQVKSMRPAYGQRQNATITVQKKAADRLIQKGRIRIGWSMCRIQERVVVRKCPRCWGFGHSTRNCKGEDRSTKCLRCAKEGHKVKECNEDPYCPICERHGHRADSMACPVYRREVEKGIGKPSSNTTVRCELTGDIETDQDEVDAGKTEEREREKAIQDRMVDLGDQPSTSHDD